MLWLLHYTLIQAASALQTTIQHIPDYGTITEKYYIPPPQNISFPSISTLVKMKYSKIHSIKNSLQAATKSISNTKDKLNKNHQAYQKEEVHGFSKEGNALQITDEKDFLAAITKCNLAEASMVKIQSQEEIKMYKELLEPFSSLINITAIWQPTLNTPVLIDSKDIITTLAKKTNKKKSYCTGYNFTSNEFFQSDCKEKYPTICKLKYNRNNQENNELLITIAETITKDTLLMFKKIKHLMETLESLTPLDTNKWQEPDILELNQITHLNPEEVLNKLQIIALQEIRQQTRYLLQLLKQKHLPFRLPNETTLPSEKEFTPLNLYTDMSKNDLLLLTYAGNKIKYEKNTLYPIKVDNLTPPTPLKVLINRKNKICAQDKCQDLPEPWTKELQCSPSQSDSLPCCEAFLFNKTKPCERVDSNNIPYYTRLDPIRHLINLVNRTTITNLNCGNKKFTLEPNTYMFKENTKEPCLFAIGNLKIPLSKGFEIFTYKTLSNLIKYQYHPKNQNKTSENNDNNNDETLSLPEYLLIAFAIALLALITLISIIWRTINQPESVNHHHETEMTTIRPILRNETSFRPRRRNSITTTSSDSDYL